MQHYHSLATTGAGMAVGGLVVRDYLFLGSVIVLVVLACALVRTGFRRGKSPFQP